MNEAFSATRVEHIDAFYLPIIFKNNVLLNKLVY